MNIALIEIPKIENVLGTIGVVENNTLPFEMKRCIIYMIFLVQLIIGQSCTQNKTKFVISGVLMCRKDGVTEKKYFK
jgi:hypothetical protein